MLQKDNKTRDIIFSLLAFIANQLSPTKPTPCLVSLIPMTVGGILKKAQ